MKAESKWWLTIALVVLTASSLQAGNGEQRGPRNKSNYTIGKLRVVNHCDEALSCQVGNQATVVLEPLQSTEVSYGIFDNTAIEVPVTVTLASDNTVSMQISVSVVSNKTTTTTVTSVVSGSSMELQIAVTTEGKGKK